MPYTIKHIKGDKRPWKVIKKDTGEVVGSSTNIKDAKDSIKARHANE